MKAEERHELRENDLASWLHYGLWAWLKQNGSYVLLVLALAFLGYRLWVLYEVRQENAQLTSWAELHRAEDDADVAAKVGPLHDLVDTSPVKAVKAQACLALGVIYDQVLAYPDDMGKLRVSREESLTKSYEYFQKALEIQGDDLVVAAKAHLGMAAVCEDRGEWDKALKEYQIITDKNGKFANTAFVALAEDRIKTLDERRDAPQLAAAYQKWLIDEASKPKPAASLPSGLPSLPGLLDTPGSPFPNLNLPKLTAPSTPSTPASAPAPLLPFLGPSIPGLAPPSSAPAEPATAPK